MTQVWLNGEILDASAARIAPDDRGFLLGDGAFETMRFEGGAIRRRDRHWARLIGALAWLEIAEPDFAAVEAGAAALAEGAALTEAVLRLTVSRGPHGGGLDAPSGRAGTVLLTARARPAPPESVSLAMIAGARRAGLASELHKLTGYAEPLAARRAARRAGADMGLMVSAADGSVVCADCASIFAVIDGGLVTPPVSAGALPGTTRAALMEAAAAGGLALDERTIPPAQVRTAEAAFLTNAVMGVVPVAAIDGRALDIAHPVIRAAAALEAGAA